MISAIWKWSSRKSIFKLFVYLNLMFDPLSNLPHVKKMTPLDGWKFWIAIRMKFDKAWFLFVMTNIQPKFTNNIIYINVLVQATHNFGRFAAGTVEHRFFRYMIDCLLVHTFLICASFCTACDPVSIGGIENQMPPCTWFWLHGPLTLLPFYHERPVKPELLLVIVCLLLLSTFFIYNSTAVFPRFRP